MPIPRPIEHADTTARDNPGADNPRQVPDPSWQAPAMIVPASSFYDPEHALQQPPADYQPWLDALDAPQPYQAPQEYGGDHQYQQPQMQYQFVQQSQGQMYQQPHLSQSTSSLVSQQRQILPQPRRSHNRSAATAGPYYRTPQSQQQPSAQQVQQQRTSELIGESFDPQHQYAVDVQHQPGVTAQHQQSSVVQHQPGVAVQHQQSGGAQHHQGGSAHHPEGGSDQRQLGSSAQHQQGITSQHQSVSAQHQPGVAGQHSQGVRQSRQYRQRHVSQPHAQVTRDQYSSSTQIDRYPSAAQADQYSPAAQVGQYTTGAQQEQYASTVQQDQYVSSAQQDQYASSTQGDPYASTAQQDQYATGAAHQDQHYAHAQQPESAPYYFQTQAQAQQQHLLSAVPETGLYHLGRASQSQPALPTSHQAASLSAAHAHGSLSMSPHTPFATYPSNAGTPTSESGILVLPHSGGSHSPASFVSYPPTTPSESSSGPPGPGSVSSGHPGGSGGGSNSGHGGGSNSGHGGSSSGHGGPSSMGRVGTGSHSGHSGSHSGHGGSNHGAGGGGHEHTISVSTIRSSSPGPSSSISAPAIQQTQTHAQPQYQHQQAHPRQQTQAQFQQMQAHHPHQRQRPVEPASSFQASPSVASSGSTVSPRTFIGRPDVPAFAGRSDPPTLAGPVVPNAANPKPGTTRANPNTGKNRRPAKRPRPSAEGESEDDSDDEDDGAGAGAGGGGGPPVGGGMGGRKTGACTHCKRLKMKCDFPQGATTCRRCATGGHPCIREGRKPRTAPNKREYLLAQIRQKDQIIESLLKQLHNPYIATPLSIASYKMATSPSDKDNINVVDWLDRLQAGNAAPGSDGANTLKDLRSAAFALDSRASRMDVGDSDEGAEDDGGEEDTEEEETEGIQSTLPDAAVPIGLLANLSLVQDKVKDKGKAKAKQSAAGAAEDDDDNIGVANTEYFWPGPSTDMNLRKNLIEQHNPPEIILHGLVNSEDVKKLFEIFWNQVNPFIGLLDPNVHTAESIFARCPFLFTVICAISSRYYSEKSEIYPIAMHFAKHSAANALIDGWKSVELCQAYILMSIYAVPARRWEEDRSWLYTGLAIRIATDLNLHHAPTTQPQSEKQEREILNRTRVWMICFNLDRSTATQFGKPSTIKEDYLTRNSADWYKQSRFKDKYDIHLCAYSSLLRIVGRFHDEIFSDPSSPTGLNKQINFLSVTLLHDEHLTNYFEEWTRRFKEESDHNDPGSSFRCTLLPFLVNYSRLVMYSFGFQHAFQRGIEASDNVFLTKCFDAAKVVIKHMIEVLAPSGFMRSAPDGHFVFASFASAFMLKLLRPDFAQLLTRQMEDEIFELIGRLITCLQDVAIDERHTPRLYARFLAGLLTKHRKGGGGVAGRLQPMPPPSQTTQQRPNTSISRHPPSSSGNPHDTSQTQGSSQRQGGGDPMQIAADHGAAPATTIYRPEIAYTQGHGQMEIGSSIDVGMIDDLASGLSEANTLATMHALNDVWWGNMMMPGFSWPEGPMMTSAADACNQNAPGFHPGFGGFPPAEMPLVNAAM